MVTPGADSGKKVSLHCRLSTWLLHTSCHESEQDQTFVGINHEAPYGTVVHVSGCPETI